MRVAVLDDWLDCARSCADWSPLEARVDELVFFQKAFDDEAEAAEALKGFEIVLAMRDRTAFPVSLAQRLPKLKLLAFSGLRVGNIDINSLQRAGVTVCYTDNFDFAVETTAEVTLSLMMAAAKKTAIADATMRVGGFQRGVPFNVLLFGKTLGIIGLGQIGMLMARYGHALGMNVVAWSPNLTAEKAARAGAALTTKHDLLSNADVVTLHMVLSCRTRGMIGAEELALLKPGAILVNTSRGPLIVESALLDRLAKGDIFAALDVYDREPLPPNHPLRKIKNTILTPHMAMISPNALETFYRQLIEDAVAFLDGAPIRLCPPAPTY